MLNPEMSRRLQIDKLAHHSVNILTKDNSFPLLAHQFEKGEHVYQRVHRHPEAEICYFPSDSGVMLIQNGAYTFSPGDMFLVAGNTYHQPVFNSKNNQGMVVVYFLPDLLNCIPKEWSHIKSVLASPLNGFCQLPQNSNAEKLVIELYGVFRSGDPHWKILSQGILLHLLSFFVRETVDLSIGEFDLHQRQLLTRFRKVLDYIDGNLTSDISMQDLYNLSGFSRTQFSEKFKDCFGMTASAYIQHVRLTKAKELLSFSSLSISEIAYACGFNWPSFFNRIFKEDTGMSPTRFRQVRQDREG